MPTAPVAAFLSSPHLQALVYPHGVQHLPIVSPKRVESVQFPGPHAKSVLSEWRWVVWLDDYEINLLLKAAGTGSWV